MFLALVLSVVATAVAPPPQAAGTATTVRVYLFTATATTGDRTPEEQGRLDAVKEMREALQKKKGISLVDDRADATLVIEVTGREQKDDVQGGFGGKAISPLGETIIRLHLTSGDQESDLKGMGQGTWSHAAKDAADRILKWIARREPPRDSK